MRRLFPIARRTWERQVRAQRSHGRPMQLESLEERSLLSGGYVQTNLIADQPGVAAHTDSNLVNPWGVSFSPGEPLWLSDNGKGVSTVDDATGVPDPASPPLIVSIPSTTPGADSGPTGTVFNGSSGFMISSGAQAAPAVFLFDTVQGTIAGWNPAVSATTAVLAVNHSASGAVYTGLALGSNATGESLYAANFGNGTIDVYNASFQQVTLAGTFSDPSLPSGYVPYNVQNLGGNLYVTYALKDPTTHRAAAGVGNGFVDEFDTNGNLIRRVASQGALNAPWGLAVAPASFGQFAGDLLVGNFGDGKINAYNSSTGAFMGQLTDATGQPLAIDGLWSLTFGGGGDSGDPNTLYFTAGPDGETHGLFGSLTPAPSSSPTPPSPAPVLASEGTTFTLKTGQSTPKVVASFIEANTKAKNFRVSVNWGDASRASAGTVRTLGAGQFEAIAGHHYRMPGTYTVQVTISDKSGHTTTATSQADVTAAPKRGHPSSTY